MSISKNSANLVLDTKRHSMAHIMAAAVKQLFPETQFGVGPVIENGCYYDFVLPRTLIPEDLPLIEAKMRELIGKNLSFKREEISLEKAVELFENLNQPLKVELLRDLATRGTTSMSEEEKADFGEENSKEIVIRKGTEKDLEPVLKIQKAGWKDVALDAFKISEAQVDVLFENNFSKNPHKNFAIAQNNLGEIVGVIAIGRDGEIHGLFIKDDYRGQGIGKKLVDFVLEEIVKQHGIVKVGSISKNIRGTNFYKKYGFEKVDSRNINIEIEGKKYFADEEILILPQDTAQEKLVLNKEKADFQTPKIKDFDPLEENPQFASQINPLEGVNEEGRPIEGVRAVYPNSEKFTEIGFTFPANKDLNDRAKEMAKNMTKAEQLIWFNILDSDKTGFKWIKQKIIDNYIVDFYCHSLGLVLEIDGDSHSERQEYDEMRTKFLNNFNLEVIRFSNDDIYNNLDGVFKKLKEIIDVRQKEMFDKLALLSQDVADQSELPLPRGQNSQSFGGLIITIYRLVDEDTGEVLFEDLCKGPHIKNVGELSKNPSQENSSEVSIQTELNQIQELAQKEGRDLIVETVIYNDKGEIFAQKRADDRRLFPGCWDLAGGHVEKGETIWQAAIREAFEEIGFEVEKIEKVLKIWDWEKNPEQLKDGESNLCRDVHLLVKVKSTDEPKIEAEKVSQYKWISRENINILNENREKFVQPGKPVYVDYFVDTAKLAFEELEKRLNPQSITIESAKSQDAPRLVEINKQTWLTTYPNDEYKVTTDLIEKIFENKDKIIAKWQETLSKNLNNTLVAKLNDIVIGYCRFEELEDYSQLKVIYIDPKYQGLGAGTKLVQEVFKKINPKKDLVVEYVSYNQKTEKFYQKMGFENPVEADKFSLTEEVFMPQRKMVLSSKKFPKAVETKLTLSSIFSDLEEQELIEIDEYIKQKGYMEFLVAVAFKKMGAEIDIPNAEIDIPNDTFTKKYIAESIFDVFLFWNEYKPLQEVSLKQIIVAIEELIPQILNKNLSQFGEFIGVGIKLGVKDKINQLMFGTRIVKKEILEKQKRQKHEVEHNLGTKFLPLGFALDKFSASYWRGDQKRDIRMQRLYALVFETQAELAAFQTQREEAKKRDHRELNKTLNWFSFDDEVGAGLPLWLPNGTLIAENIEKLAKQQEHIYGYKRVKSPHIAKEDLYLRSGHLPYYAESMFPPMEMDNEKYYLKAMNCPHHHKIYSAGLKSYKDLPLRYAEYGHCYRYEDSGSLFGLMRVRSMNMNDAHIYCTDEQFESEFENVIKMYLEYFEIFGINKYEMRLSKHSKGGLGKKYVDEEELWIKTENQVRQALIKLKVPFVEADDEAAFYGPKIDVQVWSVIGREFTLATNQLDFAVPKRFNLTYTDKNGEEKTPICIHRAPLSTHERFIGFLIEHYAGRFPFWLAPTQIKILTINTQPEILDYVDKIKEILGETVLMKPLKYNEIRFEVDDRSESLGKKIREAENQKIPVILIVGPKDIAENQVSVRTQNGEEKVKLDKLEEFLKLA